MQELLQLCLSSKDEALSAEFVRRIQPPISGVVYKCVCRRKYDRELINDLIQSVYAKLFDNNWKVLRRFVFDGEPEQFELKFFAYVKIIAHNLAEDYFRRIKWKEEELVDPILPPQPSGNRSDLRLIWHKIIKLLQELEGEPNFERDMRIFHLYFYEGYTAAEIADMPDIELSVKGVESTLLRMIRFLQGKLRRRPDADKPEGRPPSG